MWIDSQGSIYSGDCRAGDRAPTQAEIDAWNAAKAAIAATQDQSNIDNVDKKIKAVMLVMATWNGKTVPQAKAAFKTAWDSLP